MSTLPFRTLRDAWEGVRFLDHGTHEQPLIAFFYIFNARLAEHLMFSQRWDAMETAPRSLFF